MKERQILQIQRIPYVKRQKDRIQTGKKYVLLELMNTKLEVRNHGNPRYSHLPLNGSHKALSSLDYRHSYTCRKGIGARRWRLEEQQKNLNNIDHDIKNAEVYIQPARLYNRRLIR